VRSLLQRLLLLGQTDDLVQLRAAVQRRVQELVPEQARFAPLLGDLLGLPLEQNPLLASLDSQERYNRACDLLEALLRASARREPLVLVVDDLHWADPSSHELLDRLARAAATMPLLLLFSYRPGVLENEPWQTYTHCSTLKLHELSTDQSAELARALLRSAPPAALAPLLERAQGNPFFIEELLRNLIDQRMLAQTEQGWELSSALEASVPNSIAAMIVARLDRLDEQSRALVQLAAVIGRRIPHSLLARLGDDLRACLDEVARSELLVAEPAAYVFRHTLVREVAYESILFARRRELHLLVAQAIKECWNDAPQGASDGWLALLARHYLLAEEWEPAFHYHLLAGRAAQSRFANGEALALFGQALQIISRLEEPGIGSQPLTPDPSLLVELHERSGYVHLQTGRYDQAEEAFGRALALLCEQPNAAAAHVARLHRHIASLYERRGNYETAGEWLRRGLELVGAAPSLERARCELLASGILLRRQGRYAEALERARLAGEVARAIGDRGSEAHSLLLLGTASYHQGHPKESLASLLAAQRIYAEINDLRGLADTSNNLGIAYDMLSRWQDAVSSYNECLELYERLGDVLGSARTSANLATLYGIRGDLQRADELNRYSRNLFEQIGSAMGVAVTGYNLGEVLLLQGQPDAALRLFEEALATFERIEAASYMPEVLRLAAEAHLALGDLVAAKAYAARSRAVAGELQLAAEQGAADRVRGQVAARLGRSDEALELLTRACALLHASAGHYELGKARYQLGMLLQQRGEYAASRAALEQAVAIFTAIDARRDLEQARRALNGLPNALTAGR
jgi:tetratricopeptide (TPR) repeat protein